MAKIATKWLPSFGQGTVVSQPGIYFQDNLGNLIVTNTLANIIPNPIYVLGKLATAWSQV